MRPSGETEALFAVLRQSAEPDVADAIEKLVHQGSDAALCRVNTIDFAGRHGLGEQAVIGAFLHAARLGIFELSWNVLCPGCAGVLDAGTTLKTVDRSSYLCSLCNTDYEPTLDEMVEVTFTVSPRVRRIAAHDPATLSLVDYLRQIFWSSGIDLPDEAALASILDEIALDQIDLPAREKTTISLPLPEGFIVAFDPVTHATQFMDVKGEPTRERQNLTVVLNKAHAPAGTAEMRPGPARIVFENHTDGRTLPCLLIAGDQMHDLLAKRRPFLTAKRMLTNQTFRDIYRTDTLDIDQKLKIVSLTFLFTDLKGSTELYERVGDLVAYDMVRAHFRVLHEIVAAEAGAVVKTIGDAVMATFPTPGRALAAALRMRQAMAELNKDLLLKIGIHEGPCLAVVLNERQDYFGQTVNIASRVQNLASNQSIYVTGAVVENGEASRLLEQSGIRPIAQDHALRGIAHQVPVFEIP